MSAAIRQTSPNGRSRSMYGSRAIFTSGHPPVVRADPLAERRRRWPRSAPPSGRAAPDPRSPPSSRAIVRSRRSPRGWPRASSAANSGRSDDLDVDRRGVGGHARRERRLDLVVAARPGRDPGAGRRPRASRRRGAGRPAAAAASSRATTRPFTTSSSAADDRLGRARPDRAPRAGRRPAAGRSTSPGSWPSTDELEDRARRWRTSGRPGRRRPRRRTSAAVVGLQAGVGPDRAERHLGRHLVGPAEDRQPVAAVEEAVPLEDRRVVEARARTSASRPRRSGRRRCPPRSRRSGSGKWAADDEAALGVTAVGPVGEELVERAADPALGRAAGGERQDRPARAEEPEVAEHVLAVLGPDDHDVAAARICLRAPRPGPARS